MERELAQKILSLSVGSELHETWRKGRLKEDGTYEPRMKPTKDEAWIAKHNGQREVDIANTTFENLPSDWQHENLEAGKVAVAASLEPGMTIEEMSSVVHEKWLERNGDWAEPHQKLPYEQLSETEKAKDRDHILLALRVREKVLRGELSLEQEGIRFGVIKVAINLPNIKANAQRQEIPTE